MGSVLDEGWMTRWQYILKKILNAMCLGGCAQGGSSHPVMAF